MPQTREHLAVLELLGVPAGVVALTKADVVDAERARAGRRGGRASCSRPTPYAGAPVVAGRAPARDGPGRAARRARARRRRAAPRAAVARRAGPPARRPLLHAARHRHGRHGDAVVGRGRGGRGGPDRAAAAGAARVRAVQVHDERVPAAAAGRRVALNLAGIERSEVQRGDVVLSRRKRRSRRPTCSTRRRGCCRARGRCARGARVHVHHGTRETPGARRAARVASARARDGAGLCSCGWSGRSCPRPATGSCCARSRRPTRSAAGRWSTRAPRKHGAGRGARRAAARARER